MSLTPFEVFMDLADVHSEDTTSQRSSEEDFSTDFSGIDTLSSDEDGDRSVTSFGDHASIRSDTLQDFGSIVSLPPGTLAALFRSSTESHDGEQTILSSAPSGTYIPAPEASYDAWAVSPHPLFVAGTVQSIPTECTDTLSYQNLPCDSDSQASSKLHVVDSTPRNDIVSLQACDSENSVATADHHESMAFVAVANQLMRDSAITSTWYTRFNEHDWRQFRSVAKMILSTLEPPPVLLPLPPMTPAGARIEPLEHIPCSYRTEDILPANFVCSICKDVIVGALTLDCGCSRPTVCSLCWETRHHGNQGGLHDTCDELGYVWIEESSCPSCKNHVNSSLPCHALDVAILQIVEGISSEDEASESLKRKYYARLDEWRSIVQSRNLARSEMETLHHDQLLARLIQEEEIVFSNQSRKRQLSRPRSKTGFLGLGQTTIAVIAAAIASASVGLVVKR